LKVVLAGGGTGGHVYPALAVGRELEKERAEVLFIGVKGRLDEQIVEREGLPFQAVSAAPLRVGPSLSALRGIASLVAGVIESMNILGGFRPNAVFATGGYASVPVGVAARLRRKPLVVYLPDVTPGWAVRLLARLATRIATTSEESIGQLPAAKTTVTGYPVRDAFWSTTREGARSRLGLPADANVLLVTGASQGAQRINDAVFHQLDALLEVAHIIHLTGANGEAAAMARRDELSPEARERYHVFGYLDDMPAAMAAADLAVMRAGASVLGELPAAGLPAVLVPGEYEGGHNQWPNARYLASEGAAVTLANDDLDQLGEVITNLLADQPRRTYMRESLQRLARPDATQRIAAIVREAAA
jgi:UDP-N-acetylglucosamine--N-acetylmuramyl-(pentapeptide) pyrophosphoryl-undecaprenol N-acetylglucosamine transferase